jgi:hypothetical protein
LYYTLLIVKECKKVFKIDTKNLYRSFTTHFVNSEDENHRLIGRQIKKEEEEEELAAEFLKASVSENLVWWHPDQTFQVYL